jgi:hypothetical protein
MGRIQRIEEIVNSTIQTAAHAKIFPRGLPRFVDSLLRGTIRFGKRTGNSISVINTDNTFNFLTVPQTRDNRVVLERESEWLTPSAIISLGPEKELHEIDDVIDNTIITKDLLARSFTDQDQVLLHSYPLLAAVNTANGSAEITVKSHYKLANGDVFVYLQTLGLLQSITEIRVEEAVFLGTTTDPFFTLLYRLELESVIERDIEAQGLVYHRAYPAYFSFSIRVPNALFTAEPEGPFLLDILSGKLLEGQEFRETFAVKTLSRAGSFIKGTPFLFETIEKNFIILDRQLAAHVPMFWTIAEGSMRITPTRVVFKVDAISVFVVGTKCVPNLPADKEWRISVVSNEDCTMRFFFNPHPFQEFTLLSGIAQTITVTIPPGADVTDIEINILANSNICEVQVSDWTPSMNTVDQIEYSFIAEATGEATYQSTGLILKPYFIGSEFLKATWDSSDDKFDGGKIWF